MVLEEFGRKISGALRKMQSSVVLNEEVLNELVKTISTALLQADVDIHLVKKMQTNIKAACNLDDQAAGANKRKVVQATVMQELYGLLDSGTTAYVPQRGKTNVIMFVGLQGCGKTTTCTKFAYYYRKKGWKVALVCADTFRAGAFDQLKQNATKANIPYFGSHTESDPVAVARDGVKQFREENYEMIIVDTSGRHKQEEALFEEMKDVASVVQPDDVIFTMDSSIGQAAKDQAKAFKQAVAVGSVIITKLDGHAKGGGALSAVAATNSPIIFVGTGEHVDDLEPFNTKGFVQRLLGMGDISGLMDLLSDSKIMDTPTNLLKKLAASSASGKNIEFTFRDMYEQFQAMFKLGPPEKLMSMIPGMSNMMPNGVDMGKQMKNFMTIMDSMSNTELDNDDKLFVSSKSGKSRVTRIGRGSGIGRGGVMAVLHMFKPFKRVLSQFAKLSKGGNNPKAMEANLSKMLPPHMLKQMGGMNGISKMMQSMGGMGGMGGEGGMPDMSSMDPQAMQNMMRMMQGMMAPNQPKKKIMRARR